MPHRLYRQISKGQKETNMFILQVFAGDPNLSTTSMLGQKTFFQGSPEKSNADELNAFKERISKEHGLMMNQTAGKFVNVWEDENGKLFYYTWDENKGNVKTMLRQNPQSPGILGVFSPLLLFCNFSEWIRYKSVTN